MLHALSGQRMRVNQQIDPAVLGVSFQNFWIQESHF